jgi:hypothetical protein
LKIPEKNKKRIEAKETRYVKASVATEGDQDALLFVTMTAGSILGHEAITQGYADGSIKRAVTQV